MTSIPLLDYYGQRQASEALAMKTFSTLQVPRMKRLHYWKEYNTANLIGVNPSTHAEEGLVATMQSLPLIELKVTEIAANAHVIERSPISVQQYPQNAVFISFLIEGEAFFYHENSTEIVRAGEAIIYDADSSFLFGFPRRMREVILQIPREIFAKVFGTEGLRRPRVFVHRGAASQAFRAGSLCRLLERTIESARSGRPEQSVEISVMELLGLVLGEDNAGHASAHILAAKDYIYRHLRDANLSVSTVARAVSVSERHLNRIFAQDGTTVAKFILMQRLERAREQIVTRQLSFERISDISARWAFPSQAHFSRVFKEQFGETPTEARENYSGVTE